MALDNSSAYAIALDPKNIKDDLTKFLALVGQSIAIWAQVEQQVGDLYATCVGAHGVMVNQFHQPLVVSYYSIMSFDARLLMTSTALSEAMSDQQAIVSEWTTLANRISRKYKIRSNIAHFSLYGSAKRDEGKQIWLSPKPPVFGVKRGTKNGKAIEYYAPDLEAICNNFKQVATAISQFDSKVFRTMMRPAGF